MQALRFLLLAFCCFGSTLTFSQTPGTLKSHFRIDVAPGTTLYDSEQIWSYRGGAGGCVYPDVDGDGIPEVMLTSRDQSTNLRLHQLRLKADGTVKPMPPNTNMQRFPSRPGFNLPSDFTFFGVRGAMTHIGDLNGDGIAELAVGNPVGPNNTGEIYIVFMNANGKVDSMRQISEGRMGFNGTLVPNQIWGNPLSSLGDLDGDGVPDLVTCQTAADTSRGALWILFMTNRGTVKGWTTIKNGSANLPVLAKNTLLGNNLTGIGDLDRDGVVDMIATSSDSDQLGSVWVLFLNADGSLKGSRRTRANSSAFSEPASARTSFGVNVVNVGDLDGDSVTDVATMEFQYPNANNYYGRIHILFLNRDGTIKATQVIDKINSNLGTLADKVSFGYTMFPMGDFNKDGIPDLGVGMPDDDAADPTNLGRNSGGFYILNLNGIPIKTSTGDVIVNQTKDYYAYPNPAVDRLTIRNHVNVAKPISELSVIDATGKVVQRHLVNAKTTTIDIGSLVPGNYLIQIFQGQLIQTVQFSKN